MPRQGKSGSSSSGQGSSGPPSLHSSVDSLKKASDLYPPPHATGQFHPPLQQQHQQQMPHKPNTSKIENIKNYYYQLSSNLRHITQQLSQNDISSGRRQSLAIQQEKIQSSLAEFTEKVLKPLMSTRTGTPPAHIDALQFQQQQQPVQKQQYSRQLQLSNQLFHEAQQQQLAFQQRLQTRSSSSVGHLAGSRPQSPTLRPMKNKHEQMEFAESSDDALEGVENDEDGGLLVVDVKEAYPGQSANEQTEILTTYDELIERIAITALQYTLNSKSESMSDKHLVAAVEDVLGQPMSRWDAVGALPVPATVKRPTLANNTHSARLTQIRKDAPFRSL